MTPEERNALRREKILKRAQMTEQELGSSLNNNQIKQFINKAQTQKVPETSQSENVLQTFAQKEKKKVQLRLKTIALMLLGLLSAFFTNYEGLSHPPNVFWIFLVIDLTLNWKYFKTSPKVDRELYDQRLTKVIDFMEASGLAFSFIDDLSCYFVPYIVTSCLYSFFSK